jgi:hypothetical protein
MRASVALALAGASLAVVACTSTVGGHPSKALSGPSSSTPPFPSATPTLTPAPTSSGSPGDCSITDRGAPFCYALPSGFTDYSDKTSYARGWRWKTLVSIGRHDLIEVLAQPIQRDLDRMTSTQARVYVATFALHRGIHGVNQVTPLTGTQVDGARAFRQFVTYGSGVHAYAYNVLRGHSVVYLSCQYTAARRVAVLAGCQRVLATIRIQDV